MTAPEFMARAVPRLGVTDVIINSGQHFTTLGKPQKQALVRKTLAAAAASAKRGAWFRTTTPRIANSKIIWTNRKGERIRVKSWPGLPDSEDETDAAAAVGAGVMDMFEVFMRLKASPLGEDPAMRCNPRTAGDTISDARITVREKSSCVAAA